MLAVVLAFVALPPVMRVLGYSPFLLLSRCDGLAIGSVLAMVVFDRDRLARNLASSCCAFAAIGLGALVLPELAGWAWPGVNANRVVEALFTTRACLVYFSLAGLTICLHGRPVLKFLRDPRLCHMGTISYGLYLYHPLVFAAMPGPYKRLVFNRLGLTSTHLMDFAMVAVCFLLAELSWRYVEMPIHDLKERLTSRRAVPPGVYQGPHKGPAVATERSTLSLG
jgi:peptidoglycan/LPS O-acetylase OafA/YrhL